MMRSNDIHILPVRQATQVLRSPAVVCGKRSNDLSLYPSPQHANTPILISRAQDATMPRGGPEAPLCHPVSRARHASGTIQEPNARLVTFLAHFRKRSAKRAYEPSGRPNRHQKYEHVKEPDLRCQKHRRDRSQPQPAPKSLTSPSTFKEAAQWDPERKRGSAQKLKPGFSSNSFRFNFLFPLAQVSPSMPSDTSGDALETELISHTLHTLDALIFGPKLPTLSRSLPRSRSLLQELALHSISQRMSTHQKTSQAEISNSQTVSPLSQIICMLDVLPASSTPAKKVFERGTFTRIVANRIYLPPTKRPTSPTNHLKWFQKMPSNLTTSLMEQNGISFEEILSNVLFRSPDAPNVRAKIATPKIHGAYREYLNLPSRAHQSGLLLWSDVSAERGTLQFTRRRY